MPKDFKENFGQRSTSVQLGWPVIHKNKVFTKSTTKATAMTTNRATTEWFLQSKHWVSSIDNVWLGDRHNLCRSNCQTSIATSIPFWGGQSISLHLGLLHFMWISSEWSPLTRKCDPPTSSSKRKFMNTAPVPEKIVGKKSTGVKSSCL